MNKNSNRFVPILPIYYNTKNKNMVVTATFLLYEVKC